MTSINKFVNASGGKFLLLGLIAIYIICFIYLTKEGCADAGSAGLPHTVSGEALVEVESEIENSWLQERAQVCLETARSVRYVGG